MKHILLAAVSLLTTAPVSPLSAADGERTVRDFNGDGYADVLTESSQGGTGFRTVKRCMRDGATKRTRCSEQHTTAYAPFYAYDLAPAAAPLSKGLQAFLGMPDCDRPYLDEPDQAAMWLLRHNELTGDLVRLTPSVPARKGKPAIAKRVCVSHSEATVLRGAFAWDPEGAAKSAVAAGRTIVFSSTGKPKVLAVSGKWQLYASQGAVALYDKANDRHRWLVSFADGSEEGFKMDRWPRIVEAEASADGFLFKVRRSGGVATKVHLTLPK